MMFHDEHSHIFRVKSVGNEKFLSALKHNKREFQNKLGVNSHIDKNRTPFNYALHGRLKSQEIANYARSKIALAGIEKLRKNGVMAVELVFSLPIVWHKRDTAEFFKDCYQWTLKSFSGELLSFDIHLDEAAPHAHALILPLIDGKMQGDKLKGNRSKIKQRNKDFFYEVASSYGLVWREKKHLNSVDKEVLARVVMRSLKGDSLQDSVVFSWARDEIFKNPEPVAKLLGIKTFDHDVTQISNYIDSKVIQLNSMDTGLRKIKHFVDHKRAKGKGRFIT